METLAPLQIYSDIQTDSEKFEKILAGKHIKTVYQPIVSLIDGQIYGFEALSRISSEQLEMNIEEMFRMADRTGKSWELETLCRARALEKSGNIGIDKKLFLNVNSNIIYDDKFKEGFTKAYLNSYGLDTDDIIFEITERVAVLDNSAFLTSIDHYKKQNYGIAIDDVGSGYSGLTIIASVKPNIIKLDISLVKNIDNDGIKQLLCQAIVDFGKNADIRTIAEGIETEDELKTLVKLGVDFGQGFFIGIPQEEFEEIQNEKIEMIKKYNSKKYNENILRSVWPAIGCLSKPGKVFSPDESAGNIYEVLRLNPTITEFAVVHDGIAIGLMSRTSMNEIFGGKYGYSLHAKKVIQKLVRRDFLKVNFNMPSNHVSKFAMQRQFEKLYDPIVVEKDSEYFGIVTIKDLLDACAKAEIDIALQSNPLTGLPGNIIIEHEISNRIFNDNPYCITYYDIDNFKAYNDAYGFDNGDKMLQLLADILKKSASRDEFVGHIGGDDFIVICDYHEGETYCLDVLDTFSAQCVSLYHDNDVKNGYIVSKNRNGVTENFPIASLSVAGISNKINTYQDISAFSEDIARLKKECKRQVGNCLKIV